MRSALRSPDFRRQDALDQSQIDRFSATPQYQSSLPRDKQREVAVVHCVGSGGANKLEDLARVVRADYRELSGCGVVGEVGEESAERGDGT